MHLLKKTLLIMAIFCSPLAMHAGLINWFYVGGGYLGTATLDSGNAVLYDLVLGTGQRFGKGKINFYLTENFNFVFNSALNNSMVGYGVNSSLDLGYKLIGPGYAKKGFEMELLLGAFVELDFTLVPFNLYYAYGPELGLSFQFWLTPGFGLALQAKSGFNISGWGDILFPQAGLAMIWRPVDKTKLAFESEKKKTKTSSLNAGVYQKEGNVMFVYESPRTDITSIALIGDFNNWDESGIPLQEDGGVWKVVIRLEQGLYQYKYLINGKEKTVDPKSAGYTPDGLGGKNSILEVE